LLGVLALGLVMHRLRALEQRIDGAHHRVHDQALDATIGAVNEADARAVQELGFKLKRMLRALAH
jgi:hypothetical protein